MDDRHLPSSSNTKILVDLRGAEIVEYDNLSPKIPGTPKKDYQQDPEAQHIYLPKHTEFISHIALDIGGSLAKVVYFTREPVLASTPPHLDPSSPSSMNLPLPPITPTSPTTTDGESAIDMSKEGDFIPPPPNTTTIKVNGVNPSSSSPSQPSPSSNQPISSYRSHHLRRRSSTSSLPGGRLNFLKFETENLTECISFLSQLISTSAQVNGLTLERMRKRVKIMATGGGAYLWYDRLKEELGVEVDREDEMMCLIKGLLFVAEIKREVFWFGDELVERVSKPNPPPPSSTSVTLWNDVRLGVGSAGASGHEGLEKDDVDREGKTSILPLAKPNGVLTDSSSSGGTSPPKSPPKPQTEDLPRPSPNPPNYSIVFDDNPTPEFPCLLVNIGSGVSIIRVDDYDKYERVSGTSLGGGTLWGLLTLLTDANNFDEMLSLSESGDNANVDMLVGDIFGSDYSKIGLKSSTIASSFGKVFKKGGAGGAGSGEQRRKKFRQEDIARSLLYAVSNNIGQIAYMNAERYNVDRIYFGGCFIRGHAATIATLSYAIRFWSKGTKRALFLRHEGFLGSMGAWLNAIEHEQNGR